MKNETVIMSFIAGIDHKKSANLTNENGKLKSYNLVIADRDKKEIYKINYSKTTTTHINKLIHWAETWATGWHVITD